MKKVLLSLAIVCLVFSVNAQRLLSWTPEFPVDNSTLSFTVDCNKGNQGLLNFEGGNSNNVYVHIGVITNVREDHQDVMGETLPEIAASLAHMCPINGEIGRAHV